MSVARDGLSQSTRTKLSKAAERQHHGTFARMCQRVGLPAPMLEQRFQETREWAFDFCWPEHMLALESDGGLHSGGRHTRGSEIVKTHEKLNAAAIAGWRVLYTTPEQLATYPTLKLVGAALGQTIPELGAIR
jgi:hypothetical protein